MNYPRDDRLDTVEIHVKNTVRRAAYRQLRTLWKPVYQSVVSMRKQDDDGDKDKRVDWQQWQQLFIAAMMLALMRGADDFGAAEAAWFAQYNRRFDVDPASIIALYEVSAEKRLDNIADTTRRNLNAEINRWAPDESLDVLVGRLDRWFGMSRAETIARTETNELMAASSLWAFQKAGVDRWMWVHVGGDQPCPFCVEKIGSVFTLKDQFPPRHPNCHCRARPMLE